MFLKTSIISFKSSLTVRFSSSFIPSSLKSAKRTTTIKHLSQLDNFLHVNCKSGNFSLDEALDSFDYMIHMDPTPGMSSFSILFSALIKKKYYDEFVVLYTRFVSAGLLPNLITLNIVVNCLCKMARVSDGFVVFGSIFRRGFYPDAVTLTSLINGLCKEGKIKKAIELFGKMVSVGCRPDVVTVGSLITGLCRTEMLDEGVKPNEVTFTVVMDELCKNGKIDEANGLLQLMINRDGAMKDLFQML